MVPVSFSMNERKILQAEGEKLLRGFGLKDRARGSDVEECVRAFFRNEIELRFHQGVAINPDAIDEMELLIVDEVRKLNKHSEIT
jgi:hypothetical protein